MELHSRLYVAQYFSKTAALITRLQLHMTPVRVSSPQGTVGFSHLLLLTGAHENNNNKKIVRGVYFFLSILVELSLGKTPQAAGLGHTYLSSQTPNLSTPIDEAERNSELWIYVPIPSVNLLFSYLIVPVAQQDICIWKQTDSKYPSDTLQR